MSAPHSATRWARLEEIFQHAMDLDPAQRSAWLAETCGSDPELLREVEAMLRSAGQPLPHVHGIIQRIAHSVVHSNEPGPGHRLGAYRLLHKLGEGGMGSVFLAERADGAFDGKAAIKLLRPGGAALTPLANRLRSEQRIMAGLAHENIARLLDAGSTDDGAPYVVMEYVEGLPLDRWCAAHQPDAALRFSLFRQTCAAVGYAHRRLVIHRDIKPGNILVTPAGVPKLLDFGIAKLLRESEDEPTAHLTMTGERLMTPGYASPEQMRGEAVTTAVDVFALGVVLYELFGARHPFRTEKQTRWEIEKAICEADPPRPSLNPGSPASRLSKAERLDLDSIVMKALAKDPGERYATAEQLDADIVRLLNGEPVSAARLTSAYRLGKFVHRNKLGVSLAVTAVLALLAVAVVMTVLTIRVSRERATARRISQFLQSMFENADPNVTGGAKVTLRDVLDKASARLGAELKNEPEVAVELAEIIASTYGHLTEFSKAEALYQSGLQAQRRLHGPNSIEASSILTQLGDIQRSSGKLAEAEQSLTEALRIQKSLLRPDDFKLASAMNNLGLVVQSQGKFARAEQFFRDALSAGANAPETQRLVWHSNLGAVLSFEAKFPEGEEELRGVLTRRRQLLGESHPQVIRSLQRLATLLRLEGAYAEGASLALLSSQTAERVLGKGSLDYFEPLLVACHALVQDGRIREARTTIEEAISAASAKLGPASDRVALYRNCLGDVLQAEGRNQEAVLVLQQARAVLQKTGNAAVRDTLAGLGKAETTLAHYAEAEQDLNEALQRMRSVFGPEHQDVAGVLADLAALRQAQGRRDEAQQFLTQAIQMDLKVLGPAHPETRRLQKMRPE